MGTILLSAGWCRNSNLTSRLWDVDFGTAFGSGFRPFRGGGHESAKGVPKRDVCGTPLLKAHFITTPAQRLGAQLLDATMNARETEMSKSTSDEKKLWFIDGKTSSSWEEGKRRSPMTRDATELLEPFRKYLKVLAELHLDRKLARQARPLRRGPADDAARLLGPGGGCATRGPRSWSPGCGGSWPGLWPTRSSTTSGTSGTSAWSGRWRPTWTVPPRASPRGWPPTRPRPAGEPSGTRNCCAWSRPWPNYPS